MKIQAVIFDIDDTLVTTTRCNKLCRTSALDRLLAELGYNELDQARELEKRFYSIFGWARLPDLWRAIAIELQLPRPSDELIKENLRHFEADFVARLELFPTAAQTLAELHDRGLKLGIISNGDSAWQWRKLKTTGMEQFFDPEAVCISIQSDLHNCKPSTANFRRQERHHNLPSESFLYVGDRPNDVVGANVAGWTSVRTRQAVSDAGNDWPMLPLAVETPDHEIDTISHILDLI